jgi:glycosyltransferase involved in cell wall biosynthesis
LYSFSGYCQVFSPTFKSAEMRNHLSQGNPDAPLLLYVGRLGHEKKLHRLRGVLDRLPHCRLALVGEGPAEADLREVFGVLPVHFVGALSGKDTTLYANLDN